MDNTETAFWQRMQYAANYFMDAIELMSCLEPGRGNGLFDKSHVAFYIIQSCAWLGMARQAIPSGDSFQYLKFLKDAEDVVEKELAKMIQI